MYKRQTWNRLGVNETAITWGQADDLGEEKITAAGQTLSLIHIYTSPFPYSPTSTSARLVFRLYMFFDQFSIVE